VLRKGILLWFAFFLICWGLGYPTLNRYDPRSAAGTSDSVDYYRLVTERPQASLGFRGYRVLVPYTAKPFYLLLASRSGSWNPVFFAMLAANALYCSTAACLLVSIGHQVVGDYAVALLGATLFLLNFTISNSHMSGMVDSGEACLMMGVIWALFANRWAALPWLAILGALAKETFVPLALVFALGWWWAAGGQERLRDSRIAWIALMATAGVATVSTIQSIVSQQVVWPWSFAALMRSDRSILSGFLRSILDHNFWFVFLWLLPLGAFQLRRMPRPWVSASFLSALAALALGAYVDARGGNVARSMFNVMGPLLSLSAASMLSNAEKDK